MRYELFERAKPILNQIQQHGFEAYYVGGSVRDYLMGREIHDIDITTSCQMRLKTYLIRRYLSGKEHGTINVVYNDENYEVTTFRAEEDYVDHRRPSIKMFNVATSQSMPSPWTRITTHMITLMGKTISSKTDSYWREFESEALRIIRGLRFQSQLNFQIVNETFGNGHSNLDIQYLSIERIVVELKNQRNQCF